MPLSQADKISIADVEPFLLWLKFDMEFLVDSLELVFQLIHGIWLVDTFGLWSSESCILLLLC